MGAEPPTNAPMPPLMPPLVKHTSKSRVISDLLFVGYSGLRKKPKSETSTFRRISSGQVCRPMYGWTD